MSKPDKREVYTVTEAADLLGCDFKTLHEGLNTGRATINDEQIPVIRVMKRKSIPKAWLDDRLRNPKALPTPDYSLEVAS